MKKRQRPKQNNMAQRFKGELASSINRLQEEKGRAQERKDRRLVKLIDFQILECHQALLELE